MSGVEKREIEGLKVIKHSILPKEAQEGLIAEIRLKLQSALTESSPTNIKNDNKRSTFFHFRRKENNEPEKKTKPFLYVAAGRRYYENARNIPFDITKNPEKYRWAVADVAGPFSPELACAVSYLEQEKSMLIGQHFNEKARDILGVRSVNAFGQGIARLTGQLGAWSRWPLNKKSLYLTSELIEIVVRTNKVQLEKEIGEYENRYKFVQREFGYGPDSTAYFEWEETKDRLKGFDKGLLLLEELLRYPWKIEN